MSEVNTEPMKLYYRSDFLVHIKCDAGWGLPFTIKFWSGSNRTRNYVASFDGEEWTNCHLVDDQTLCVAFDDHGLGVGQLYQETTYSFGDSCFPTGVDDEILQPAEVVATDSDGAEHNVILDFTGVTSASLVYALPMLAAEQTRQTNEAARVAAEAARVSAENARVAAENSRVSAENARASAESGRVTTFNTNEAARQKTAKDHDDAWAAAEAGRVSAEAARASAEAGRVSTFNTNEAARQKTAKDHDDAWAAAEAARVSAESGRASAERARVSSESSRVSAESARSSAESGRVSAESARVAAENARAASFNQKEADRQATFNSSQSARQATFESSETARQTTFNTNETARQQTASAHDAAWAAAEAGRVSAENARVAAEGVRGVQVQNAQQAAVSAAQSASAAASSLSTLEGLLENLPDGEAVTVQVATNTNAISQLQASKANIRKLSRSEYAALNPDLTTVYVVVGVVNGSYSNVIWQIYVGYVKLYDATKSYVSGQTYTSRDIVEKNGLYFNPVRNTSADPVVYLCDYRGYRLTDNGGRYLVTADYGNYRDIN